MDKYKDIRPYHDHEVRPVLEKLLTDPEFLISIARFYYPRLSGFIPRVLSKLVQARMRRQLKGVHDVNSMQDVISGYMDKMIHDTTTELSNSGMQNLAEGRNYLFVSNHRDIAMDPAFVNYMLYHAGHNTLQVAIGDNLLKKPFVSELMRLNKSFIVRRSLTGREQLRSLKQLSGYIHHCINTGQNVWIAQREGRAKDGIDRTDPALLKMLAMARKDLSLSESLRKLRMVPVSISYEYDACDSLKAEELYQTKSNGNFTKTDETDIKSIATGLLGFKGRVHVAFGSEISCDSDNPDEIAAEIDSQVIGNYKLWDTNKLALQRIIQGKGQEINHDHQISSKSINMFEERLRSVDPKLHEIWLNSYANPILSKLDLESGG